MDWSGQRLERMNTGITILHVDDDPDIRLIVALSLELDPLFTVRSVGTATEAQALLADALQTIDAIVLDHVLPDLDGIALIGRIRALPARRTTPILFLTARATASSIAALAATDAVGTLLKPFDPTMLAIEVRELIGRPRSRIAEPR